MSEVRYASGEGQIGRIIVARLLPGTDLMEGLNKICDQYNINNGVIVDCIGSLRKAVFKFLIPNPKLKLGSGYGEPYTLDGPIEFLGGQGIITQGEDGKRKIHLHGLVNRTSVEEGKAKPDYVLGGDFGVPPGSNLVLATMDITIIEVKGLNIIRKYDTETEIATRLDFEKA
ncbi:MAG: DNA-binding protein [Candidatus Bathyarchaeia archaeon]